MIMMGVCVWGRGQVYKESMAKSLDSECLRVRAELLGDVQTEIAALQVGGAWDARGAAGLPTAPGG